MFFSLAYSIYANFTFRNRYCYRDRYRKFVDADTDSENKIIGKSIASGVLNLASEWGTFLGLKRFLSLFGHIFIIGVAIGIGIDLFHFDTFDSDTDFDFDFFFSPLMLKLGPRVGD